MRRLFPYLANSLIFSAILAAPVALTVAPASGEAQIGRPLLVLAAPGSNASQIVLNAGGLVLSAPAAPFVVLGYAPDGAFAERARDLGALGVFSFPEGSSWLCL